MISNTNIGNYMWPLPLLHCHQCHYITFTVNRTLLPQNSTSDHCLKPLKQKHILSCLLLQTEN